MRMSDPGARSWTSLPDRRQDDGAGFRPGLRLRDLGPLRRRLAHQSRIVLEGIRRLSSRSSVPSIAEYEAALAALKEYQAAVDKLFDSVDVIVTPTVPVTAPPIAGPIDGMKILRNTWPFNAAGTPAISIPLTNERGLPVGLQLIASRGETTNSYKSPAALRALPKRNLLPVREP